MSRYVVAVHLDADDPLEATIAVNEAMQLVRHFEARAVEVRHAHLLAPQQASTTVYPLVGAWSVGCTGCLWTDTEPTKGRAERLGEAHLAAMHPEIIRERNHH